MKNITLLISVLFLSACAPKFQGEGLKIQPDFQVYVNRFIEESNKTGHPINISDLTIEFDDAMNIPGPQGGIVIGLCATNGISNPKITINTNWWKMVRSMPAAREQLIFHEMGHCVLNLGHNDSKVRAQDYNTMLPVSVMNSYAFGAYTYGVNYSYYMNQLFGNSPEALVYSSGTFAFNNSWYPDTTTASMAKVMDQPTASTLAESHSDATMIYPDENGNYDYTQVHCAE